MHHVDLLDFIVWIIISISLTLGSYVHMWLWLAKRGSTYDRSQSSHL